MYKEEIMLERLEEIKKQGLEKINSAKSSKELEEIRRELLGKKSPLTEVLKTLGSLDVETKKQVGMKANEIKNRFDEKLNEKDKDLVDNARVTDEEIDEIAAITAKVTDTVGVELWHYKQNADFRKQIIDRCKKYNNLNIVFTAGSDFHGANKVQNIGEISPDELTAEEQRFFDEQIKHTLEVFKNRNIIKDRD